jgi:hypothetical protein
MRILNFVFCGYTVEEGDPLLIIVKGFLEVVPDVYEVWCPFVRGQEVLDLFGGIKHVRSIGHF